MSAALTNAGLSTDHRPSAMTHARIRHHRGVTDYRQHALDTIEQARRALADETRDPRAAAIEVQGCARALHEAAALMLDPDRITAA